MFSLGSLFLIRCSIIFSRSSSIDELVLSLVENSAARSLRSPEASAWGSPEYWPTICARKRSISSLTRGLEWSSQRSSLDSLGTSSRTKSYITFDTQSCTSCIKSLFISKSNRRKKISEEGEAVVSDSLITYFSRLAKLCEPRRKICASEPGVVI